MTTEEAIQLMKANHELLKDKPSKRLPKKQRDEWNRKYWQISYGRLQ